MSKKIIITTITFISIFLLPTISKAENKVELTFKFITTNTISGFDYVSKLKVYCDGNKIGESSEKIQSESNTIIVKVPTGNHTVRAVLYALSYGKWEERIIENDYSLDFEYNETKNWTANKTINLTFDIKEEKTIVEESNTNNNKVSTTTQTGNYKDALKKINTYLKTFDNGYYGYLEVQDGYLYDRFASGKYSKVKISDVDIVSEEETNKKVTMKCKYDNECVYSTYTDSYHTKNSFSQSKDFNTKELVDLINDFLDAYNGKSNTISTSVNNSTTSTEKKAADIRAQKAKERQQQNTGTEYLNDVLVTPTETNIKTSKPSGNYNKALNDINEYFKKFNPEIYDKIEVKEGKIYFNFNYDGKKYNSSIDINELKLNTTVQKISGEIKIACKNNTKCFYSTYSKGYADHFRFYSNTISDLSTIELLVKDFVKALK